MKVLLDENLDHRLRTVLGSHEVFTASYKGWDGLKNGNLLQIAEDDGLEVFVTGDQSLAYEQNLAGRRLAIVALSSIEWRIVRNHLPKIIAAIDDATPVLFRRWNAAPSAGISPPTSERAATSRAMAVHPWWLSGSPRLVLYTLQASVTPDGLSSIKIASDRGKNLWP